MPEFRKDPRKRQPLPRLQILHWSEMKSRIEAENIEKDYQSGKVKNSMPTPSWLIKSADKTYAESSSQTTNRYFIPNGNGQKVLETRATQTEGSSCNMGSQTIEPALPTVLGLNGTEFNSKMDLKYKILQVPKITPQKLDNYSSKLTGMCEKFGRKSIEDDYLLDQTISSFDLETEEKIKEFQKKKKKCKIDKLENLKKYFFEENWTKLQKCMRLTTILTII